MNFTKTQKSRHLENETLSFLQIKKSLITHEALLYGKNTFVAEVTFKKLTFYGISLIQKKKKIMKRRRKFRKYDGVLGTLQLTSNISL